MIYEIMKKRGQAPVVNSYDTFKTYRYVLDPQGRASNYNNTEFISYCTDKGFWKDYAYYFVARDTFQALEQQKYFRDCHTGDSRDHEVADLLQNEFSRWIKVSQIEHYYPNGFEVVNDPIFVLDTKKVEVESFSNIGEFRDYYWEVGDFDDFDVLRDFDFIYMVRKYYGLDKTLIFDDIRPILQYCQNPNKEPECKLALAVGVLKALKERKIK
jgi:hypothetical protein